MDKEMIERMAEAIHNSWQATGKGPSHRTWVETCEKLPGQANDFRKKALAVAKAMREPTEKMHDAGLECGPDHDSSTYWYAYIDTITGAE